MKVMTVLGARPQFVKSAPVSSALRAQGHHELLVHTGQHYDDRMSEIFFKELGIPQPDLNLGVGSGPHGQQTGRMLIALETAMQKQSPHLVLVYGDTNSTLAGALAACKLRVPVAHIEAGLRSFNRDMPEEHNRVITDHCSDLLFCPTRNAVENLRREGINTNVYQAGDTMRDAVSRFYQKAARTSGILRSLGLNESAYRLMTLHRPSNVDSPKILERILGAMVEIDDPIVFPIHPRTKKQIDRMDRALVRRLSNSNIKMVPPVGYLDMLILEKHAKLILTDSGGMQKEAFFLKVPCVTLRDETEWTELVQHGFNMLAGNRPDRIHSASQAMLSKSFDGDTDLYGDGHASEKIVEIISKRID